MYRQFLKYSRYVMSAHSRNKDVIKVSKEISEDAELDGCQFDALRKVIFISNNGI